MATSSLAKRTGWVATAIMLCALATTAVGTPAAAASATPVPGDPLTGSGAVSRNVLTAGQLTGGGATGTVADSAFALPANAAPPRHAFEGRLQLSGEATGGGFTELRDDYNYTGSTDSAYKHLPEIDLTFVQNGSHLVPTTQGLVHTGHSRWNLIAGPGRAWSETGDNGWSRASLPFALVQRNANCTHNGVLTFLFNAASVSQVRYQITQETCVYFKFDLWGQLPATYTPATVANGTALKNAHAAEVAGRLPTRSITELATDHPSAGLDLSKFGAGVTAQHMTAYGLYYRGVNYVSGCTTRQGAYPFCGQLRLPSYSTAKSAFAGIGLMRLGQKYGTSVAAEKIRTWVPETAGSRGNWTNVTFNHAVDMATGNYQFATFEADEGGSTMSSFFLAEPYSTKMSHALSYPARVAPGTRWVYHSSDTFIVTRAMNNYLVGRAGSGADIFNLVRDEVYGPAGLSAGAKTTERTDNSPTGVPFGGYGLFWNTDDIAKLAKLLNNDNGVINGSQVLHPSMLAASMQRDPADRGIVTTSSSGFHYNNGFWAKQFTPTEHPQYNCSFWVPFMSGYGGITVAMMPNGATYYYVSDNGEFSWAGAVNEAAKLGRHC